MNMTYRGKPPGQFAEYRGWTLCWSIEEIRRGEGRGFRATITAIHPRSPRPVFRDMLLYPPGHEIYKADPSHAEKVIAAAEAEVRKKVNEIEDLEASWLMKSST